MIRLGYTYRMFSVLTLNIGLYKYLCNEIVVRINYIRSQLVNTRDFSDARLKTRKFERVYRRLHGPAEYMYRDRIL